MFLKFTWLDVSQKKQLIGGAEVDVWSLDKETTAFFDADGFSVVAPHSSGYTCATHAGRIVVLKESIEEVLLKIEEASTKEALKKHMGDNH